jgi:penicillin-binding protein 1A
METILIKILAAFLALSQVTTRPDDIKTKFDPVRDQAEVTRILRDGCGHMRKAFDVESIDLDGLIKTAMEDPDAVSAEIKAFHGLKFESLIAVYQKLCKKEDVKDSTVDIGEVIQFYNNAVADLPDANRLKGARNALTGGIVDANGARFADLTESNRRIWIPLSDIPLYVQQAFVAAEDKRFFEHKGIDERGLVRAMVANLARPGRPQGGSTITQQVVKNLLVGDDVTYERKMREIIIASRIEHTLTKSEILELYLNSIYLGRGAWGVELAAKNYFGKSASALSVPEGATLAGLPKGPTYYSPDRHPDRAQERLAYVVTRMKEDGDTSVSNLDPTRVSLPRMVPYDHPPQRDSGYYFVDNVTREARTLPNFTSLSGASTTVHTTIRPDLQRAAEAALQEGLAQYEMRNGRVQWHGPEGNIGEAVRRIEAANRPVAIAPPVEPPPAAAPPANAPAGKNAKNGRGGANQNARAATPAKTNPTPAAAPSVKSAADADGRKPAWQQALQAAHPPLYDVHWPVGVVLGGDRGGDIRIGLADGRVLPLASSFTRRLNIYDLVFVKVSDGKGQYGRAELRARPTVQGATVVLDNKTGAILAMVGGFSYPASQLNRVTQSVRQPGSSLKPFTYLAALRSGLQPNTLVRDEPLTLAPIGHPTNAREKDYWSPKNADGGGGGISTLRRGLENSKNLVTAHLLDGGIDGDPSRSLSQVCDLTIDAQVYRECVAYYPFVLGAQPARLIDMAAFYAAIATEGHRPTPYSIESIDQGGRTVYSHKPELKWLAGGDRASFFQLRTMLQGVVARGTARAIGQYSTFVGGKTGTSDDENDAWFVGFTNDVAVGVWVGYDNADGKRRTLGGGQTGGQVAVPIFQPIIEATWTSYAHKAPLAQPSPEAKKELVMAQIDLNSGSRLSGRNAQGFTEYFRLRGGQFEDTQYRLVPQDDYGYGGEVGDANAVGNGPGGDYYSNSRSNSRGYYGQNGYYQRPSSGGFFGGGLFGGFFGAPQAQQRGYGGYGGYYQRY